MAVRRGASAQVPWASYARWSGEACSGAADSAWTGITCSGGRVVGVRLQGLRASGPIGGFGQLPLRELSLSQNNFTGACAAVALCSQPQPACPRTTHFWFRACDAYPCTAPAERCALPEYKRCMHVARCQRAPACLAQQAAAMLVRHVAQAPTRQRASSQCHLQVGGPTLTTLITLTTLCMLGRRDPAGGRAEAPARTAHICNEWKQLDRDTAA